jgi:hypothetical protein
MTTLKLKSACCDKEVLTFMDVGGSKSYYCALCRQPCYFAPKSVAVLVADEDHPKSFVYVNPTIHAQLDRIEAKLDLLLTHYPH